MDLLREQVYHDVMACIGCNDCLLACPLPESREVTIAELNQAALAEAITAGNVVDFVTRCTQCQQCVPACPADLSRANIVAWNQMKVESVAPDRVVPLQAGERVVDSRWTVDRLARRLASLPIFEGVDRAALRRALLAVTLRSLALGEVLAREGEYYERLVVVMEGSLEQTALGPGGERTRILVLGPGTFHGHMSVMGNTHEPFTISAVDDSTVVEFTKAAAVRLMAESAPFRATMETLYRDGAVWTHVRASPLLAALPEKVLEDLLEKAALAVLRPGEVLYREGEPASALYLVRSGFLRVARRFGSEERVLQYFHEGEVCGASSLLFARPHSATVSANTRAEVIVIPAGALNAVLGKDTALRNQLTHEAVRAESYLDRSGVRPPTRGRPSEHLLSIEGLLEEGVVVVDSLG
ncbi:MAG: cyclic nucleotide-binding domain-containing protein, partial [Actinomycetota bacterium]